MSLTEVFFLFCACGAGYYWLQTIRLKELARLAAKRACIDADLLLLDDTVQLLAIYPGRDSSGKLKLFRRYKFEYSQDGDSRHSGVLTMQGRQVVDLLL